MSDNIPFEIQEEIIKRLPIKSLIQFRSVSKTWKSLIDTSQFIAQYSNQQTKPQHLLVSYEYNYGYVEQNYVSIVDDDSFPQQKVSVPLPFDWLKYCVVIGCSHGLICLYGDYGDYAYRQEGHGGPSVQKAIAVLWNISIRKAVAVVVPNVGDCPNLPYRTRIGFGVCRETTDPKIVKITYIDRRSDIESVTCIPWQVEVFTLSSGAWRRLYSSNLPRKSIQFDCFQVVVNGVLYWLAADRNRIVVDGETKSYNLIVSFDMTSEEFIEVNLPDCLAHNSYLSMSKLRESLVVLEFGEDVQFVWMMGDGFPKSFTKLYSVNVHTPYARVTGFRKSGEPIIEIIDLGICELVYEPYLEHIDDFTYDEERSFSVHLYMETLLLLDQQNLTVYNDI